MYKVVNRYRATFWKRITVAKSNVSKIDGLVHIDGGDGDDYALKVTGMGFKIENTESGFVFYSYVESRIKNTVIDGRSGRALIVNEPCKSMRGSIEYMLNTRVPEWYERMVTERDKYIMRMFEEFEKFYSGEFEG